MIFQTTDFIAIDDREFPKEFLEKKGFPPLQEGLTYKKYDPVNRLFCQSNGKKQTSAGTIPWEEGDSFLRQKEALFQELQESTKQEVESPPEDETVSSKFMLFLLHLSESQLYQLGKYAEGAAKVEFEDVVRLVNGPLLSMPGVRADGGKLQKSIRDLMRALGLTSEDEEILEINQFLKNDLDIEWTI